MWALGEKTSICEKRGDENSPTCGKVGKFPNLWESGEWLFHHDNVPAHTTLSVRQFLTKNGVTWFCHPPYSPDLAPCDFFVLFPLMKKKSLKENVLQTSKR